MNTIPDFDSAQVASLRAFLDAPDRSPESMGYCQAAGFLFGVACAPELVQPSEWLPVIIDPDNATETSVENMRAVTGGLISLYNELTRQVQEVDVKLPPGCRFLDEPMTNLEPGTTISQWADGFKISYNWLEEMWSDYVPEELSEEFTGQLAVLTFFSSRDLADAILSEVKNKDVTPQSMAADMQQIFPDAMHSFTLLGNSIQQVIAKRDKDSRQPAMQPSMQPAMQPSMQPSMQPPMQPVERGKKIGRNEPCTCGSGKKYKKCCGSTLH